MNEFRIRVLLSMQRALLGQVTRNIRAVAVNCNDGGIAFRVLYFGIPSEEDILNVSEIETEVVADFPEEISIHGTAEECGSGAEIQWLEGEDVVFCRAEPIP